MTRPPSKYGGRDGGGSSKKKEAHLLYDENSLLQIMSELETKEQGKFRKGRAA